MPLACNRSSICLFVAVKGNPRIVPVTLHVVAQETLTGILWGRWNRSCCVGDWVLGGKDPVQYTWSVSFGFICGVIGPIFHEISIALIRPAWAACSVFPSFCFPTKIALGILFVLTSPMHPAVFDLVIRAGCCKIAR